MFRKFLVTTLIAALAVGCFANVSSVRAEGPNRPETPNDDDITYPTRLPTKNKPWYYFQVYSMTGASLNYAGYQYAAYARQIAMTNGYDDGDTNGSFYQGEYNALYGFKYGYYGHKYGFKDWILHAADLNVASRNYEKGIYDYLYNGYYQKYPRQLQGVMDALSSSANYADLSRRYYYLSIWYVDPPQAESSN